jgi:hypothetical protein
MERIPSSPPSISTKRPDRVSSDRDGDVFRPIFLAILLVAEPDVADHFFKYALHHLAVANHSLVLVANFPSILAGPDL